MKVTNLLFLLICLFTVDVCAQRILAFDKRGKVKRVKYYEGSIIKLKLTSGAILLGSIDMISDNNFVVDGQKVYLDSVTIVYNTQKFYGFKLLGKIMTRAGIAYFTIDSFNKLINNESPVFNKTTIGIGGGFFVFGLINHKIANKAYRISPKRPLKIIDLTI